MTDSYFDSRVRSFVLNLIEQYAVKSMGGWHLPQSVVQSYRSEFSRLWFEKYGFSYEFLYDSPNHKVTESLMRYFDGKGDRNEVREDVVDGMEALIFGFYRYDIEEYIGVLIEDYTIEKNEASGLKRVMCSQTGTMDWQLA
jgi:hypothetical protein